MSEYAIIVGYNGSDGARAAMRWAAAEATRRAVGLRLVYALEQVHSNPLLPGSRNRSVEEDRCLAESALGKAVLEVTDDGRKPIEVSAVVIEGSPVTVLCDQSRERTMVVLGSRGVGGLTELFGGSVSLAVAAHAHCPVVVVRAGEGLPDGRLPVVVGVDESSEANLAVGFAVEEAALHGVGLVAVRAWTPPPTPWRSDVRPLVRDAAELQSAEEHVLAEALRGWLEKYPAVPATTRLMPGDPRHALTVAAQDARLAVVGSRGVGGFPGLLLGSVSHYLLHHALCPVAVVREAAGSASIAGHPRTAA
jgi:nucleotide-binding universal stress UspA family protein